MAPDLRLALSEGVEMGPDLLGQHLFELDASLMERAETQDEPLYAMASSGLMS